MSIAITIVALIFAFVLGGIAALTTLIALATYFEKKPNE